MGMLKKIVVIIILLIYGCNSDESKDLSCQLSNLDFTYLDKSEFRGSIFLGDNDHTEFFEYDSNNNITKINGGLAHLSSATGFNFFFSPEIYDSIAHLETQIKIIKKHIDPNRIFIDSIIYEVNSFKKPLSMRTQFISGPFLIRVEEEYLYENNELKKSIINQSGRRSKNTIKTYFYDENDNLVRIESEIEDYRGNITERQYDYFEMYDAMPNPFRNKFYIKGGFYRSLSKNNYSKHRQVIERLINNEWLQVGEFEQNFMFDYDSNSFPKFGDYNCN